MVIAVETGPLDEMVLDVVPPTGGSIQWVLLSHDVRFLKQLIYN